MRVFALVFNDFIKFLGLFVFLFSSLFSLQHLHDLKRRLGIFIFIVFVQNSLIYFTYFEVAIGFIFVLRNFLI